MTSSKAKRRKVVFRITLYEDTQPATFAHFQKVDPRNRAELARHMIERGMVTDSLRDLVSLVRQEQPAPSDRVLVQPQGSAEVGAETEDHPAPLNSKPSALVGKRLF